MIEIRRPGTLRVRGAGLEKPVEAEHAEIRIVITARPKRVTWSAHLANGDLASPRDSLDVTGSLERATIPGNLALRVEGRSWPFAIGGGLLSASGQLDGHLSAQRTGKLWKLAGDVAVAEAEAAGSRLAGDRLRVDRVTATWDIDETAAGWSVRRLDVNSPIAQLEASGSVAASDPLGGSSRVDGTIDLAAVAAQLPHALRLREGVVLERGTADVRLATDRAEGIPVLGVTAKISDLVASDHGQTFTLHEPATLSARLKQTDGVIGVDWLSAETPYMNIKAQGELKEGVALTGTLDLSGLKQQFGALIDFGKTELSGRGVIKGSYRAGADRSHPGAESYDLGLTVDLKDVRRAPGRGVGRVRTRGLWVRCQAWRGRREVGAAARLGAVRITGGNGKEYGLGRYLRGIRPPMAPRSRPGSRGRWRLARKTRGLAGASRRAGMTRGQHSKTSTCCWTTTKRMSPGSWQIKASGGGSTARRVS